ncbi:MAG: hypothetical protein R2856_19450 [Caldilineaceae bacterium]
MITNGAFNHHHGMQALAERFGDDVDADGDGVVNELNRADISAVVLYQATLPVPGRVIPNDPLVEQAILDGERLFHPDGLRRLSCAQPALEDDA